jgi:hypothetical protein
MKKYIKYNMKNKIEIINSDCSAVHSSNRITIGISEQEAEELRSALAIVQKYQKEAIKTFKKKYQYDPSRASDWCEFSYGVKNDKVFVDIRDGMAG